MALLVRRRIEGPPLGFGRIGRPGQPFVIPYYPPQQAQGMAEWKPSFEHGISDFRLEKYEEALMHFNEVRPRLPCLPFDEN